LSLRTQLVQRWLRRGQPGLNAVLTRLAYAGKQVRIGARLRCDGVPRCLVDASASLVIGDDVELRRGVEIRVHGQAHVVIESDVRIDRGVRILATNQSRIVIGRGSRIGMYSVLNGGDSITLGQKVLVSGFVYLQTSMHRNEDPSRPIRDQGYDHAPVEIGDGAWLAAHVVVMPGVHIGHDAVVGSNGVVTRDVPASQTVVGVPARPIHADGFSAHASASPR
jgi:acetyltransferase-like isoleucine patch superfamily enzyme